MGMRKDEGRDICPFSLYSSALMFSLLRPFYSSMFISFYLHPPIVLGLLPFTN